MHIQQLVNVYLAYLSFVPQSQPNLRKRPREHDTGRQQPGGRPEKRAMNAAPTSTSPANRVSAGTIRRSLPDKKTVDYDAVYDGDHRHTIVEYPKGSNEWYILCCDEHSVHFGANPLQGASKHLNGKKHGYQRKDFDLAVQMLGVLVLNCDAEKAKLNNLMFGRAWDAGYRPLGIRGPKVSLPSEKRQSRTSYGLRGRSPTPESAHDGHAHGTHQRNGIGESPTGFELRSQTLPTSMRSSTQLTTHSDLPSSSMAVVQSPGPEEAPQGPSAEFTIRGDLPSSSVVVFQSLDPEEAPQFTIRFQSLDPEEAPQGPSAEFTIRSDQPSSSVAAVQSPDPEKALQGPSAQFTIRNDPVVRSPNLEEAPQGSSRQLTTHNGLPSSSVTAVQSPQGPSAQFAIRNDPVVRSPDLETARQGSSGQLTTHSGPSSARLDLEESRQESSRQLTTHNDPSSARQPLDLSGLAERALAVAVQDTLGLDPENPGHSGDARPSSIPAQPSAARVGNETPWTPFPQAHTWVTLPPLGEFFHGVGQERGSEWDLNPGKPSPTSDSLTALRARPLRPKADLLPPDSLPEQPCSSADSDGQYSCPGCSKKFNRMMIMDIHCEKKHGILPPPRALHPS